MSDNLRIPEATREDRVAIGWLWQELTAFHKDYDERFHRLKPGVPGASLEHLDECTDSDDHIILVAEAGGHLVGFHDIRLSVGAGNPIVNASSREMGLEPHSAYMPKGL